MMNAPIELDLSDITKQAVKMAARKSGGMTALAKDLGITYQALWKWDRVPLEHCARISALSRISRRRLRPDIYG